MRFYEHICLMQWNWHIIIIIFVMLIAGSFGGYLNYLNNFDTLEGEQRNDKEKAVRNKYILLGIGAAFLVPNFLQMISSNLIRKSDPIDYLIFFGFCLIAAIFSRRFITTIGEKILEVAKRAERNSIENKKDIEKANQEIVATNSNIDDVKLSVDLKNIEIIEEEFINDNSFNEVLNLANSYTTETDLPDYKSRVKAKSELSRRLGEIIVRNKLNRYHLLEEDQSEGMLIGLIYSVILSPDKEGVDILIKVSQKITQKYSKYKTLVAFDNLARLNLIPSEMLTVIYAIIVQYKSGADSSLSKKVEETIDTIKLLYKRSNNSIF